MSKEIVWSKIEVTAPSTDAGLQLLGLRVERGRAPAPTSIEPTSALAGHDGEAFSVLPSLASAAASCPSEQISTPANFASKPFGRTVSIDFTLWVPSALVTFNTKGVNAFTVGLI